jgi:hypothetical protein
MLVVPVRRAFRLLCRLALLAVTGGSSPAPTPDTAAELIDHAADLGAASSVLTHENERRWRIFHERVEQITTAAHAQ